MTRNKWQTQRFGTMARNGLALALSLSMVLGMMPTGALQALAEEADVLETTPLEASLPDDSGIEEAAGSGATELQDESAENEGSEDAGAAEEETTAEELEPGVTEEPGAAEEPSTDEAVAEGEGVAEAVDEAVPAAEVEAEDTQLEAEADGVRATLVVAAGVELPEGARLVVTPLDAAVEQAAAAAEEAAAAEAEGGTEGVFASALSGLGDALAGKDSQVVTGADVALTGMTNAVDECVAKQESEAPAADEDQQTVVSAAYAIEVVDGEDHVVAVDDDQAELTVTFDDGAAVKESEGVYAVKRDEAQPDDKPQVTEAMGAPVATVAEEEYKSEKAAAKAMVFSGEATDVTDDVKVDEESGAATIVLAGAPSVVVTKNAPKKVPAGPNQKGASANPVEMGKNTTNGTGTVDTNSLGFVVNLYNYDVKDTIGNNPNGNGPNTYNNDPRYNNNGHGYDNYNTNYGINAGRDRDLDLKFYASGDGAADEQPYNNASYPRTNPGNGINEFTGVGKRFNGGNFYTLQYANQGIVKPELSPAADYKDRYPVVNTTKAANTSYLFDTNDGNGKTVYKNVNNLFYYENYGSASEKLVYDSNEHYAYYDTSQSNAKDGGNFTVYTDTYDRAGSSKSGMKVGFFPFDHYAAANETPRINPNEGAVEVTHHLGLSMRVPLTMPKDGIIRTDHGNADMVFEFSGDDDMWVFIDGKLVLDIGGIHQPVSGSINFHTGEIKLGQGTVKAPIDDQEHTYSQAGYSYPADGILQGTRVLGDLAYLWNGNGHTGILGDQNAAVGKEHTLQVFYLERGGCDSNLKITTNIHLMTHKTVEVYKEWKGTNGQTLPENDSFKKPVQVRLIREETNIDDPNDVTYVALDTYSDNQGGTQTLEASNNWYYKWSNLKPEGWRTGSNTIYCKYSYYVQEVTPEGAVFGPLYRHDDSQLTVTEATYQMGSSSVKDDTVKVIDATTNNSPVTITNVPTTIEVEKQWQNQSGTNETADAIHDSDSVWVQLYKQTKDSTTGEWSDPAPVYTGDNIAKGVIKLEKTTNWKGTFQIGETGDNVRYLVKEGTYDSASKTFTASDTLTAGGGKQYVRLSTTYTPKSVSYKANNANHDVEWTNGTTSTEYLAVPESGSGKALIINKEVLTADVVIKKTDAQDQHVLEGAKFKVYKDTGANDTPDGAYVKADDYKDAQLFSSTEYTTGANGTVSVTGLYAGTYWFVETSAPAGYLVMGPDNPIGVKVMEDGTVKLIDKNGADINTPKTTEPSLSTANDTNTLTVPNARLYQLPSAGGLGAYPFLLAGSFIAALAFDRSGELRRKMLGLIRRSSKA